MKTLRDYLPRPDDIGGDFCRWMNRPLKRVQVYTWKLANNTLPEHPGLGSLRCKPEYRNDATKDARQRVAMAVKCFRIGMRGNLPAFDESLGCYVNLQTNKPL